MATHAALGLAVATAGASVAEAARPLQTEDARVLESRKCELESGADRATLGSRVTSRASYVKLGCGVGAGTDVALALKQGRKYGRESYALDLKGTSQLESLSGESLLVAVQYGTTLSRDYEGTTRLGKAGIRGIVSWSVASWSVHADVGWQRDLVKDYDYTTRALAVERAALPSLDLMAEVVDSSVDVAWVNAGLRWRPFHKKKVAFDAAYGVPTSGKAADMLSFGFKMGL